MVNLPCFIIVIFLIKLDLSFAIGFGEIDSSMLPAVSKF